MAARASLEFRSFQSCLFRLVCITLLLVLGQEELKVK